MKVPAVLQAQSMRLIRTLSAPYLPKAVVALIEKYEFVGVPAHADLVPNDPTKGILTFRTGKCELDNREIPIEALHILPNGVGVITRTNTADSDLILDELIGWATASLKMEFASVVPGTIHTSQLEFQLEHSLASLFPALHEISAAITNSLDDVWGFRPAHELITMNFWFDKNKFPQLAPAPFRIDRRDGVPFEQNTYWSEAAMTTEKHIAVLSMIERVCLDASGQKS